MKAFVKLSVFFLGCFVFLGCENPECDDTSVCLAEIESTWALTEAYFDPGDGSGSFTPINSNRTITFFENDTFASSGSLCNFDVNDQEAMSGGINRTEGLLEFPNCFSNTTEEFISLSYSISGDELILSFLCDEPCQWKFIRVYDL